MILDRIKEAMEKSGKSRYQIFRETGVDQAVLCRIATGTGTGSCSIKTADTLLRYFGLEVTKKRGTPKRG